VRSLQWYIARRYLGSRKKGRFLSLITLIAVGGVALGVTALITVIAVMTGLQQDLQAKILGSNPHIYVFDMGSNLRLGDWRRVLPRVTAIEGVVGASPYVNTQIVAMRHGSTFPQPGLLYGIDPTISDVPLTQIEQELRDGTLSFGPTASGLPGALIGRGLAQRLNVLPGDTILVAAFENLKTDPMTGYPIPVPHPFEVVNTFRTGMYEYDNANLYVSLVSAQELLDLPPDTVTGLFVNVRDSWRATEISNQIFLELGQRYFIDNWVNLNTSLFSALKLEKLAMAVILFMIVLVAAFNIVSTLIMVVADKTREIGILKSMGLTRRAVLRVFMLMGLTIGLIGTTLGVVGGLSLVFVLDHFELIKLPGDVYFIDTLPLALEPRDFVVIVLASTVIAFVATIYPAMQAAKLLPVEAIRHD
jgi:lipoprotein-releasing system permease protein